MDSALAQLQHRRRTLPEHAELARLRAEQQSLASDLVAADTAVSDLQLEQTKAESDLEPVRERLARNQRRIADGSVPDAKALASMVAEIDHLKKRISDLEDAELEVMEQLESAAAARERLRSRTVELEDALAQTTARRDEQLATLDADIGQRRAMRGEIAPGIDADPAGPLRQDRRQPRRGGGGRAADPALHRLPAGGERRGPRRVRRGRRRRGAALRGVQPNPDPNAPVRALSRFATRSKTQSLRDEEGLVDGSANSASACALHVSSSRTARR